MAQCGCFHSHVPWAKTVTHYWRNVFGVRKAVRRWNFMCVIPIPRRLKMQRPRTTPGSKYILKKGGLSAGLTIYAAHMALLLAIAWDIVPSVLVLLLTPGQGLVHQRQSGISRREFQVLPVLMPASQLKLLPSCLILLGLSLPEHRW